MEWLSLKGDLTRQNAVEQLLTPSTSEDPDSELCVHTASVRRLDVVTAAAIRMRMARHHREHTEGTVTLVLPSQVELAARLFALLDPLPGRVTLTGQVDEQPPANYSLVPATIVPDSHAAVALGGATLDACERARISRRRSIFVTEAAMSSLTTPASRAGAERCARRRTHERRPRQSDRACCPRHRSRHCRERGSSRGSARDSPACS